MTKYPHIHVEIPADTNAHTMMWTAIEALRMAGVPESEIDAYWQEARSGDQGNVLRTTMRWVDTKYQMGRN